MKGNLRGDQTRTNKYHTTMSKIIAIANHKGGVGKTTSVASVGSILANYGKRVLLLDLDAQANLTSSLLAREPKQEETVYNSLKSGADLPVITLRDNLDIVCSSLEMAGVELELSSRMEREYILKELLEPLQERYDYILLDTPPSLGLVTLNALVAATDLYIPLTAEALPSRGLKMLLDILQMVKKRLNPTISLSGVIITRWESSNLSKMVEETLRSNFGEAVFNTKIRKNIAIAEAPLFAKDIVTHAPDSNGAKDYQNLTEEIIERTSGNKSLIFAKEFSSPEGSYSVGELVGEPNEDGEQDYTGYSIGKDEFSVLSKGEDFLSEDEVEELQRGGSTGLQKRNRATLLRLETLYKQTRDKLLSVGFTPKSSSLLMDEIENLTDEETRARAKETLTEAIRAAIKIATEK